MVLLIYDPSYWKREKGSSWIRRQPRQSGRPYLKKKLKTKRTGSVVHFIEKEKVMTSYL
jgi:hypothetical protein